MKKLFGIITLSIISVLTLVPICISITNNQSNKVIETPSMQTETNNTNTIENNEYVWNDERTETLIVNLEPDSSMEPNTAALTFSWNILMPEDIIYLDINTLGWDVSFKHTTNVYDIDWNIGGCDINSKSEIKTEHYDTLNLTESAPISENRKIEVADNGTPSCDPETTYKRIEGSIDQDMTTGDTTNISLVLSLKEPTYPIDGDYKDYFISPITNLTFDFYLNGVETNEIKLSGTFLYQYVDLSRVTFSSQQLDEIQNYLEFNFIKFMNNETTYNDVIPLLENAIDTQFTMDWEQVEIVLLNNGVAMTEEQLSQPIGDPTISFKIIDSNSYTNYNDGDYWYGQSPTFTITLPNVNFSLTPTSNINEYGNEVNYDSWESDENWIMKGDENDVTFRTNSDMIFSFDDPYVEYAVVQNPDGTEQVVNPGEEYLIEYDIEQQYATNYDEKIIFYLKNGEALDFTYNVKQRATPVEIRQGSTIQESTVYHFDNSVVDGYTLQYFPTIVYDQNLVESVEITTPSGSVYNPSSGSMLVDDGYGLYTIETIDHFGNKNIQVVEVYQDMPKILTTKFSNTQQGRNFMMSATSLGYTMYELEQMEVQDLWKINDDISYMYDLSTFELNHEPIVSYIDYLNSTSLYVGEVREIMEQIIFKQIDVDKKDETWNAEDYLTIEIYDSQGKKLEDDDSLPNVIKIGVYPNKDLNINNGNNVHTSYESMAKGYYLSQEFTVYDDDIVNLSSLDINEETISSSIGYYDVASKTFGDIEPIINEALISEINSIASSEIQLNSSDLDIKWITKTKENEYNRVILEDDDSLEDLLSETFSYQITSTNDKSYGEIIGDVTFDFYQSTDLSTSTVDNVNNDLVPIYVGTEFWQVKEWLDEEILYLINENLYHYEYLKEPLTSDDIKITYSIDEDYKFMSEQEVFSFQVEGLTQEYHGTYTGNVNFNIKYKINEISTYSFNNESLVARNEEKINQMNNSTTLEEIKPGLEEEIATQLNIDNSNTNSLSTQSIDSVDDLDDITTDDLIFEYSISNDEEVLENEFYVDVFYKYQPDQEALTLTLDLNTEYTSYLNGLNQLLFVCTMFVSFHVVVIGGYNIHRKVKKKRGKNGK